MGVSATKRLFKLAVTRNFIKRRMRECLRLNKPVLTEVLYIGNKIVPYTEFNTKINQILIRLSEKCNTL